MSLASLPGEVRFRFVTGVEHWGGVCERGLNLPRASGSHDRLSHLSLMKASAALRPHLLTTAHVEEIHMALPELTDEQRMAALEKAKAARRLRAELKRDLADGTLSIEDVLEGESHIAQQMRVTQLLTALPKIGAVKAEEIMAELNISPSRRVRGLGIRQKRALLERFGFDTHI